MAPDSKSELITMRYARFWTMPMRHVVSCIGACSGQFSNFMLCREADSKSKLHTPLWQSQTAEMIQTVQMTTYQYSRLCEWMGRRERIKIWRTPQSSRCAQRSCNKTLHSFCNFYDTKFAHQTNNGQISCEMPKTNIFVNLPQPTEHRGPILPFIAMDSWFALPHCWSRTESR